MSQADTKPIIAVKIADEPEKSRYEEFLEEHKRFWILFNVCATLGSIGLAIGTYFVVTDADYDCNSLKFTLWLVFALHVVNTIETIMNLTGLEGRYCSGVMMCGFFIFEITILVYMQFVYFESRVAECYKNTGLMYFWLMLQILILYATVVMILCFFFRKFCGDPALDESQDEIRPETIPKVETKKD